MNSDSTISHEYRCLNEMSKNGLPFDGSICADGKIQRYSCDHNKREKDEWYVAHRGKRRNGDEYLFCSYGSWSISKTIASAYAFKSWEFDRSIDRNEREWLDKECINRVRETELRLQETHATGAAEANRIWDEGEVVEPTDQHLRYCTFKQINQIGVRFGNNPNGYPSMIIPIRNVHGDLRSLQFVSMERDGSVYKTFLSGGEKQGNFFAFGNLVNGCRIFIVEGYATGASIFAACGSKHAVVVAFDCHNLDKVLGALRRAFPASSVIICGDDDVETGGNPGRTKAEEAAKRHQVTAVFPKFSEGKKKNANGKSYTDFNDLAVIAGIDEVANQLNISFIPDWVLEINKVHAVVHTSQTYILTEKYDYIAKGVTLHLESVQSFHTWYKPKKDSSGQSYSKLWLEHPCRREFRGIVFNPAVAGHYDDQYNLFQGFPIAPKQGRCDLFWSLLKEGLCDGDEVKYGYVRKWLSHMMQLPWELPETALAFRGQQGIGKGTIVQYLARLVGKHYLELVHMDQVVGRFNGHLKDALLVYANEALWGGSKSSAGALKAMITDAHQAIEHKGKDLINVQNFKRLIFSSNEDWIVPRDGDDRRFFVIDCSSRFKGDNQFFAELHAQMESGGVEALMYDLMNIDISHWHPREMPKIADGFDLKIKGMSLPHQWLYDALREGMVCQMDDDIIEWPEAPFSHKKQSIYNDYKRYCEDKRLLPERDNIFWKHLRQILSEMVDERQHGESRQVRIPGLSSSRTRFERYAKADGSIWAL